MAKGKGGLGRGLESLFEDAAPSLESDAKIETLPQMCIRDSACSA